MKAVLLCVLLLCAAGVSLQEKLEASTGVERAEAEETQITCATGEKLCRKASGAYYCQTGSLPCRP